MSELHTNPTQLTGLIAFALAALACGVAARCGPCAAPWWRIAGLQGLCLLEVLFGFRHRAHDLVDAALQAHGWYGSRGPLQSMLMVAVLTLAAIALLALARLHRRDARLCLAAAGTGAALTLFVVEAVSLHGVDAVMYLPMGPVLLIGWCWAACAAAVAGGALRHAALTRESAPARPR